MSCSNRCRAISGSVLSRIKFILRPGDRRSASLSGRRAERAQKKWPPKKSRTRSEQVGDTRLMGLDRSTLQLAGPAVCRSSLHWSEVGWSALLLLSTLAPVNLHLRNFVTKSRRWRRRRSHRSKRSHRHRGLEIMLLRDRCCSCVTGVTGNANYYVTTTSFVHLINSKSLLILFLGP